MRRLVPLLAAALVGSALTAAAIVLPARATGGEDAFAERLRQWEQCMRDAGLDLDGETVVRVDEDGVTIDGEAVDPDRFRDAERACGRPVRLPPAELDELPRFRDSDELPRLRGLPPRLRDRLERLEDCLRPREA
jgi:hypothetical protein